MAILIDGDASAFRAAAYGRPHESTVHFLRQQFDDPSNAMRFANSTFFQKARDMFEQNYSEEAMRQIDAVRRNISQTWALDEIHPIYTLEALQQARPVMQRWIMANPTIRRLYKQGRVQGYGESYIDHKHQGIGVDHYDYRLATSGLLVESDECDWEATTYMDELLEGDRYLTYQEQRAIQDAWAAAELHLFDDKYDPTSPENNQWG